MNPIILSLIFLVVSMVSKKKIIGMISLSLSLLILVNSFNFINLSKSEINTNECSKLDQSGKYMNNVLDYLTQKNFMLSTLFFYEGNGSYSVDVINTSSTGPDRLTLNVLVNECGKIVRVK